MARPYAYVMKDGGIVDADVLDAFVTKAAGDGAKQVDAFSDTAYKGGIVRPPHPPEQLQRLPEVNPYHNRATQTKAEDTVGKGWQEFDEDVPESVTAWFAENGDEFAEAMSAAALDFETVGYGIVELVFDGDELDRVEHIPAATVRFHKTGRKAVQQVGRKKVWFRHPSYTDDNGDPIEILARDGSDAPEGAAEEDLGGVAVWWVSLATSSTVYGMPDIVPALGALSSDLSRQTYNTEFFDNYGVPAYALFISGDFDEGDEVPIDPDDPESDTIPELHKMIADQLRAIPKNPHSGLVLTIPSRETATGQSEVKVELKALAVEVEDASFRLFRQDNRDEVLAAHGVSPYRLGIATIGALGQNVAEETDDIYRDSLIAPRQRRIERMVNRWIIREYLVEGDVEAADWFRLVPVDVDDAKDELEMLERAFKIGGVTPAQVAQWVARRFGWDLEWDGDVVPVGMDDYFVNGIPVGGGGMEAAMSALIGGGES